MPLARGRAPSRAAPATGLAVSCPPSRSQVSGLMSPQPVSGLWSHVHTQVPASPVADQARGGRDKRDRSRGGNAQDARCPNEAAGVPLPRGEGRAAARPPARVVPAGECGRAGARPLPLGGGASRWSLLRGRRAVPVWQIVAPGGMCSRPGGRAVDRAAVRERHHIWQLAAGGQVAGDVSIVCRCPLKVF